VTCHRTRSKILDTRLTVAELAIAGPSQIGALDRAGPSQIGALAWDIRDCLHYLNINLKFDYVSLVHFFD